MDNESCCWQKLKQNNIFAAETFLRSVERDYVSACGRFLSRNVSNAIVWVLQNKKGEIKGLLINSRSTLIPVLPAIEPHASSVTSFGLCGGKSKIPSPAFLKKLFEKKKIHSVQGLRNEVLVFENEIKNMGAKSVDIFDYDLMSLDNVPAQNSFSAGPSNLVLRAPQLTDLDALAPLQAAYEQEEVLPKGSAFSPAASRVNLANIIARRQILIAEICGRLVGKININAVSFTRYQIGGVFVHPDFRGLGIARRMAAEFVSVLINEGKGVTLFVKKSNAAARRLYTGLGFSATGDYRITYY